MENRVIRFYELHKNKWFHIMNLSLEIIKTDDKKQRSMLMKYGSCFFTADSYNSKSYGYLNVGKGVRNVRLHGMTN
jgi:hypothetical protein